MSKMNKLMPNEKYLIMDKNYSYNKKEEPQLVPDRDSKTNKSYNIQLVLKPGHFTSSIPILVQQVDNPQHRMTRLIKQLLD
jgi:hypothetical protein